MQKFASNSLKRLPWFGIGLVLAVVLAVASRPVSHSLTYIRYVSPPRLDGTRCTFLYPASFGTPALINTVLPASHTTTGRRYEVQGISLLSQPSKREAFVKRFGILSRAIPTNSAAVSVLSEDFPAQTDPPQMQPVQSQDPRYAKSECLTTKKGFFEHDFIIRKKHSSLKYQFTYLCNLPNLWDSETGDYKRTDAVVSQSFQVLPPGMAVPADTPKQAQ